MTKFEKLFRSIPGVLVLAQICTALLLCVSSCGYQMGSMMHPQIKSIAIAEIKNDAMEPQLTNAARMEIAAQFQSDNSLELKQKDEADCILYCRIISTDNASIRYDSDDEDETYIPSEFRITVNAEFTVIIPGRSEPLVAKRSVSGSANYQYNADPSVGKYYGMRQACYNLARQIVEYTTEAW